MHLHTFDVHAPIVPVLDIHGLSTGLWVVIVSLGVIQLSLLVWGLVVLSRTAPERLTLPKWAWVVIMMVFNTIGPIAFLLAGRRPVEQLQSASWQTQSVSASQAADLLYGRAPGAADPPSKDG